MSPSDRLSDRVVEEHANRQVNATERATRGADDTRPRRSTRRIGAAGLRRLRQQLSDRDLAILVTLRELHYLTSVQLERLHFHDHATALAGARAARRVLHRLHEQDVVYRLDRRIGGVRAGSASYVYGLSSLGFRLVGTGTRRRSREPSLSHLEHVLDVAEIVVSLTEHTGTMPDVELTAVAGEPACWRRISSSTGASVQLKPDLRLTLRRDEQELHWFVEVDRGSEHRPVLLRKLLAYVDAWKDGGEQAERGVFPRVLWSVPDHERAEVLASIHRCEP